MALTRSEGFTVGEVAALVGITVRTLHHWDSIALVHPSQRTETGYRLYTATDIARIHRVLVYRELGVPLTEIGALLDAPATDALSSLRRQRERLRDRITELEGMGTALDRMIEARESGILLSAQEQVAIFGAQWQPNWVSQAQERWGDTAAWAQYAERAAYRTVQDWQRITDGIDALNAELAVALRAGVVPGSARADALAERHRASMRSFFDCSHSMHVCLGRTYVEDPGYFAFYDDLAPGLATWLHEIIDANARAHGIDPASASWV